MYNTTTESYETLLKRAKLTILLNRRLQDILILMFKVKNKLTMDQIADIFNINEENTYILWDVLLCSIAEYFYELRRILTSP